jgi:FAD/FMN-containing dehydrogenase
MALTVQENVRDELSRDFAGELIAPGDAGYEEARLVWNGAIDKRPSLIARCTGTADVIAAVRCARANGQDVAIRGGGHSNAGHGMIDGGMVIDCSPMKGIRVDPTSRTATAQPGVLWGELDRETQAFGLGVTGGEVSDTGIAGLTLGGGIGWLKRMYGLTCDSLLSVDLVTAEGELVHASEKENVELYWGVRGAGANFGVVTQFEYRLHPVGPLLRARLLRRGAGRGHRDLRDHHRARRAVRA